MSLRFLLDGYNIIHQNFTDPSRDLYQQRQALVDYVEQKAPQGKAANQVTIVFDGKQGLHAPRTCSVRIVFSGQREADDVIEQTVAKASNKKNYVVVTDDRKIQYAIRALGATAWSVAEFWKKGEKSFRTGKSSGPKVTKGQARSINAELEDIWLKNKSS